MHTNVDEWGCWVWPVGVLLFQDCCFLQHKIHVKKMRDREEQRMVSYQTKSYSIEKRTKCLSSYQMFWCNLFAKNSTNKWTNKNRLHSLFMFGFIVRPSKYGEKANGEYNFSIPGEFWTLCVNPRFGTKLISFPSSSPDEPLSLTVSSSSIQP